MSGSVTPKVSVCVVTYNQEKYIAQCLQSLVDQQTDFPFEVIVSDDCSKDATPQIIQEFAKRYPNIVRPILHQTNMGAYRNLVFVHEQARGEYVAHMDGDDYALPGKLAAQARFLDENLGCNIVWHRMYVLYGESGDLVEDLFDVSRLKYSKFTREDIAGLVSIGYHSAKMYRNLSTALAVSDFPVTDYFMNMEHIKDGWATVIGGSPLGVYRAGIGIASSGDATKRILQKTFHFFSKKYPNCRGQLMLAAGTRAIGALRRRNYGVAAAFFSVIIKTVSLSAFGAIPKHINVVPLLRLPKARKESEK